MEKFIFLLVKNLQKSKNKKPKKNEVLLNPIQISLLKPIKKILLELIHILNPQLKLRTILNLHIEILIAPIPLKIQKVLKLLIQKKSSLYKMKLIFNKNSLYLLVDRI